MNRQISVAVIQDSVGSNNKQANWQNTVTNIEQAVEQGAELILLQELHSTLYFCQEENTDNFNLAEPIPGTDSDFFAEVAARLNIVLVASFFEQRAKGLYHNTAAVFDGDRGLAGIYRKMHIPDDPGFYEKFYFTPGDLGFNPISTRVGNLGVLICWDQWFPEAARLMTMAGADVLLYPTAIGWDKTDSPKEQERQHAAWETIQRGHAIANGIPVVVANRVGFEPSPDPSQPGINFWGQSFVTGPQGEIIAKAGPKDPTVLLATLDIKQSETVQRIWPFFRDRRIDAYEEINKRWRDGRSN